MSQGNPFGGLADIFTPFVAPASQAVAPAAESIAQANSPALEKAGESFGKGAARGLGDAEVNIALPSLVKPLAIAGGLLLGGVLLLRTFRRR